MGWGRGPFHPSCRDSSILAGEPSLLLQPHCLARQHLLLLQPTCYCGGGEEEERNHRAAATPGCKAGPTGGGRRVRPRASSCAGDSRAGWPVRKVGPGWLAASPHNAPPPEPHPPSPALNTAAAASTDYPAAPAAGARSLHRSTHRPPAARAAVRQLQPKQSLLPFVRIESYARRVVPFCIKIRLNVNGISCTLHSVNF